MARAMIGHDALLWELAPSGTMFALLLRSMVDEVARNRCWEGYIMCFDSFKDVLAGLQSGPTISLL